MGKEVGEETMNGLTSIDKLNFQRFKEDSENYSKFKKKFVKLFFTDDLMNELKRRKILQINWITNKVDLKESEYWKKKYNKLKDFVK
jgi:hypothetical protein